MGIKWSSEASEGDSNTLFGTSRFPTDLRRFVLSPSNNSESGPEDRIEYESSVDVIFVHDITQGRDDTWMLNDEDTASLPYHLSANQTTGPINVFLYGYNPHEGSPCSDMGWQGFKNMMKSEKLESQAKTFISTMEEFWGQNVERHVLLVAHGYGGLICEKALIISQSKEREVNNVFPEPHGLCLLGTPHFRAGHAQWASMCAKAFGIEVPKLTDNEKWLELDDDLTQICSMQKEFYQIFEERVKAKNMILACCFETLPLPKSNLMLSPEWAVLPFGRAFPLNVDHFRMTRSEPSYGLKTPLPDILDNMVDQLSQKEAQIIDKQWLFERLFECRRQLPGGRGFFMPKKHIKKYSSIEIIKSVLLSENEFNYNEAEQLARYIHHHAPRLFFLAIHLRLPLAELKNCPKRSVKDGNLLGEDGSRCNWIQDTHHRMIWKMDLSRYQWEYFAATFSRHQFQLHQDFHPRQIVPYIRMDMFDQGAFSTLYEVELEASHQKLYHLKNNKNPPLALKRLDRRDQQDSAFRHEESLLRTLLPLNHLHIIRLLATYRQENSWHFLFPLAQCNLEKYMSRKEPEHSRRYVNWKLNQILGLSKGLQVIHNREAGQTNSRLHETGYHHDIKPRNILHFKELDTEITTPFPEFGVYQIGDFGTGKFQPRDPAQSSGGTRHPKGTVTYSAPESQITAEKLGHDRRKGVFHISRPYDIWAFGCVIMEMIVWLIKGRDGLKNFSRERFGPVEEGKGHFLSNAYWMATPNFQGAKVRPIVTEMLDALREDEMTKRSQCLKPIIDLVPYILQVKPKERLVISQVVAELERIVGIAQKDSGLDGPLLSKNKTSGGSQPTIMVTNPSIE